MFVQVQVLKESPAALSLENLFEENGCSCERHPGKPSYLIHSGRQIECKIDENIPLVVPGVQATEHHTKALGDRKPAQAVEDHERRVETKLPEWPQQFTEGLTRGSSSSTDVPLADGAIQPPALPPSAHGPTPRRSETNGVAERGVQRVKAGTTSVWTSRKLVERSNDLLLLSPTCARPTSRWPDAL